MGRAILLILLPLSLSPLPLLAQSYFEVGLTANYRRSSIDTENWQETLSYTGSVSYYFWQMSALELSYTQGLSELSVKATDSLKMITTNFFSMTGLDLVISFADRRAPFQPYVKLGAAYMSKTIRRQTEGFNSTLIAETSGLVPSAGLGFRILITETLSLRVGLDSWTNPLNESPLIFDYAGRAGISWMF